MKKRRPLSLIEMMVSLFLISLLLVTLLTWYRTFASQKERFTQVSWPLKEERYAFQRLQHILPSASLPFLQSEEGSSLIFMFDRGAFSDPKLSGKVLARLYYDRAEEKLCLGIWPLPSPSEYGRCASQTWVILDRITSCSFQFYHPPDPFKQPVDPQRVDKTIPLEGWQDHWRKEFQQLPALMQIVLTRTSEAGLSDKPFSFYFDFSSPIIYPMEHA